MIDIVDSLVIGMQTLLLFMNLVFFSRVWNDTTDSNWIHFARFIHPLAIVIHSTVIVVVIFS